MDPLTVAAASAVVGAMATQAWEQARQTVVGFWQRRRPDDVPAIAAELEHCHAEVVAARAAGDQATEEALVGDWQRRLRRLLGEDPALRAELQRVLDEELTPLLPRGEGARSGSVMMSANVSDQGKAYFSAGDMTINEGSP